MSRRVPVTAWKAVFWSAAVFGFVWALWKFNDSGTHWPYEDKVKHAAAFAVLVVLGWQAGYRVPLRLGLGLVLLGGAIEIAQSFTGWRSAEWGDLLADSVGVALGLWLAPRVLRQPAEHGG